MAARSVQTRQPSKRPTDTFFAIVSEILFESKLGVRPMVAVILDGIHTEVICCCYQDRIFVIVSQFEKIGTLISVNKLSSTKDALATGTQTFSTKTLMGIDEEIWHVYAKQIAKLISESSNKPVLLGIALKKHSPQILQQILHLLQANKVW